MKAIFFDLDGVLIDTEWIYNKCWTQASKDLGYDLPPSEILKLRSCDKLAAVPIFGSVENYLAVRERRKQIMEKMLETTPILPKKGVVETVEGLRKTDLYISIVTASSVPTALKYLKQAGLKGLFENIISTKDIERGKPFPDVYLAAAKKAGFEPSQCYAVEDSPNGLRSAKTAGCVTIMIPDLTPLDDEVRPYTDYCVGELIDIFTVLDM